MIPFISAGGVFALLPPAESAAHVGVEVVTVGPGNAEPGRRDRAGNHPVG